MAFSDRRYGQESFGYGESAGPRSPLGGMAMWSVNTWIIVINIAVFVLDALLYRFQGIAPLASFGYFSADTAIYSGQIWRFITFQFLHAGIGHIFFNMLALFFFGQMVERWLGSRRYLAFYLICGVAGPVFYLLFWASGLLVTGAGVPLVGASAGVFGVLIAAAAIAPNTTVMLLFPPIPMKLKTLAWIFVGIAAFTVVTQGNQPGANAGGEAAHLGGAALGYLLIKNVGWLAWANRLSFSLGGVKDRINDRVEQTKAKRDRDMQLEVDRILRKVHDQGIASLSDKEKKTLANATERQRRG